MLRASVVRAGRKVQRLRAALLDAAGEELVHVTAVALRTAPVLERALPVPEATPPGPDAAAPFDLPFFTDATGYHRVVEMRMARGTWGDPAVTAWMRSTVPLVAGEPTSPLQRLLVAVDSASGVAVTVDPARYTWVNADLTVALHRGFDGEWLGLEAATSVEVDGVALTRARLWDARGPVGVSLQSLVIDTRRDMLKPSMERRP